jgi:hypothetical protein
MPPSDKDKADLSGIFRWNPIIQSDWIDMPFVLQEVEGEVRTEVLAVALETMANVHQNVAEGARKIANIIRGTRG